MTTPSPKTFREAVAPVRALAAFMLLGVTAFALLLALLNLVPTDRGRFFSANFAPRSSHFYTSNAAECEILKTNPDWQFESIAFHTPQPDDDGTCALGTDPVYRMYNNGQTGAPNHRFTTDLAVRNDYVTNRGFVSEGVGPLGVAMCAPR